MGLLWTLQGFDVIGGSSMSGTTTWSIIGPLVMLAGAALVWVGIRGRGEFVRSLKTRRPGCFPRHQSG